MIQQNSIQTFSSQDAKYLTQNIKCNGKTVTALVDTGANASVISEATVLADWEMSRSGTGLSGADGRPLKILGKVKINISLRLGKVEKIKTQHILVVSGLTVPFLLGMDLMSAFKLKIETDTKTSASLIRLMACA